jgi:hypothetical protein
MPLPREGDECFLDGACDIGLACHPEEQTCGPRGGDGDSCRSDESCAEGLFCHAGSRLCRPTFDIGLPCVDGNECDITAVCVRAGDEGSVCAPRPTLGEPCTEACVDGAICASAAGGVCAPKICTLLD